MLKKVVTSVKAAWNNAVEEFEQQQHPVNDSSALYSSYAGSNQQQSTNDSPLNGHVANGQTTVKKKRSESILRKLSIKRKPSTLLNVQSAAGTARQMAYANNNRPLQDNITSTRGSTAQQRRPLSGIKRKASTHNPQTVEMLQIKNVDYAETAANGIRNLDLHDKQSQQDSAQSKRRKFLNTLGANPIGRHSRSNSAFSFELQSQHSSSDRSELGYSEAEAEVSAALDDLPMQDFSEDTIKHLKIRIHELETLVAQKDHIMKIMREEIQRYANGKGVDTKTELAGIASSDDYETEDEDEMEEFEYVNNNPVNPPQLLPMLDVEATGVPFLDVAKSRPSQTNNQSFESQDPPARQSPTSIKSRGSTVSYASSSLFTMLPTPVVNTIRPGRNSREADAEFDDIIDGKYHNDAHQSFEVLSPISINMDRFISSHDPHVQRKRI